MNSCHRPRSARLILGRGPTVVLGVFVILAFAFASPAAAQTYGGYKVQQPCCNGDPLYGTRASITTPSSASAWNLNNAECVAYRSDAEDFNHLIQVGFLRCAAGYSVGGSCGPNPSPAPLLLYTEIINFGVQNCYPRGNATYGATYLMSLTTTSSPRGRWLSYINGATDNNAVQFDGPSAVLLSESPEYTGSCGGAFTVTGRYGDPNRWQRLHGGGWFTVQSASSLVTCGWSNSAGPPNAWTSSH